MGDRVTAMTQYAVMYRSRDYRRSSDGLKVGEWSEWRFLSTRRGPSDVYPYTVESAAKGVATRERGVYYGCEREAKVVARAVTVGEWADN